MKISLSGGLRAQAAILLAGSAMGFAQQALAQETATAQSSDSDNMDDRDTSGLKPIVVTAQRREQNLQRVAISVTAIDDEVLRQTNISDSLGISKLVPNLSMKSLSSTPNISIRGVGNNNFNASVISPVTIYRDEVPLTGIGSIQFALFDLERVEVLRGPQGTLFGKNTTGGAVLFSSKIPDDQFEGYGHIGYGRFNLLEMQGGVTTPIGDDLSLRFSGIFRRRDGDKFNLFNGKDVGRIDQSAIRATMRFRPQSLDGFEGIITAGYSRDTSDFLVAKSVGQVPTGTPGVLSDAAGFVDPFPDDPNLLTYNFDSKNDFRNWYITSKLTYEVGDLTFRSITGFDKSSALSDEDNDAGPSDLNKFQPSSRGKQFSQEFQIGYSGGRHDFIAGAYYLNEKFSHFTPARLFEQEFTTIHNGSRTVNSYAVFAQDVFKVTDRFRITVGGRYTWDRVNGAHFVELANGWFENHNVPRSIFLPEKELTNNNSALSWRLNADYDLADEVLIYASANRSFKAGGVSIGTQFSEIEQTAFRPEFITAYEAGLKSELLDRLLRLNISIFHYDYTDIQVLSYFNAGVGSLPVLTIQNAGAARINGLELEAIGKLSDELSLSGNIGLLDAKYTDYPECGIGIDCDGNRLADAPKLNASAVLSYEKQITDDYQVNFRIDANYNGKRFFTARNEYLLSSQHAYTLVNMRAGFGPADRSWEIAGSVRNLLGQDYITNTADQRFIGTIITFEEDRRYWTLEANFKF